MRGSSDSVLHNQAHSAPKIYISFRFGSMNFTVKICQIVAWHKYYLSISRILEFYFWRVFDIWLHSVAGAETPRAPPFTLNQNHPCSAQSYQLCPSQNKSIFFVASVKKLKKQKNERNRSHSSWSMRQPNWS